MTKPFNIADYIEDNSALFESFILYPENNERSAGGIGLSLHLERLKAGAEKLGVYCPNEGEIRKVLKEGALNLKSPKRVRLLLNSDGLTPFYSDFIPTKEASFSLITYNAVRPAPEIKSTKAAAVSLAAREEAAKQNADEALLVDDNGIVVEGAWSNFFWLDNNNCWQTPKSNLLYGVARGILITFLNSQSGLPCQIVDVSLENILTQAKSAIITNSISGASPVKSINNNLLPTLDITRQLITRYNMYRLKLIEEI